MDGTYDNPRPKSIFQVTCHTFFTTNPIPPNRPHELASRSLDISNAKIQDAFVSLGCHRKVMLHLHALVRRFGWDECVGKSGEERDRTE